jgi:hypothetical protein
MREDYDAGKMRAIMDSGPASSAMPPLRRAPALVATRVISVANLMGLKNVAARSVEIPAP